MQIDIFKIFILLLGKINTLNFANNIWNTNANYSDALILGGVGDMLLLLLLQNIRAVLKSVSQSVLYA